MIAELIRLSALYVLVRVFVAVTMPSSKHIVKYLFWSGVALTIISSVGPVIARLTDDIHSVAVTYSQGKETVNSVLGGADSTKLSVGYQGAIEKLLGNARFEWPIKGKVTQEYKGDEHHGIDVAGKVGDKIKTSRPGKVKSVGNDDLYGMFVIIDHGNGWESLYGHCSKVVVKEGDMMLGGDKIAEVGNTGKSSGSHLHFEIRQNNGTCIDPIKYLK